MHGADTKKHWEAEETARSGCNLRVLQPPALCGLRLAFGCLCCSNMAEPVKFKFQKAPSTDAAVLGKLHGPRQRT